MHITTIWCNIILSHHPLIKLTQDSRCTAETSCVQMITEYTPYKYCDMFLTLHACNNDAATDTLKYMLHYPG
jgi:hypothetical protein